MTVASVGSRPSLRLRVARLLTELLAPVVLVVALVLTVAVHAAGAGRGLFLGLVVAFFCAALPYAVLLAGIRTGRLGDHHLTRRQDRPAMMVFSLGCVAVGLSVTSWLGAPREIFALLGAMVAGVLVSLAITMFWKVSIHTACAAGACAVLAVLFGPAPLVLAPVVMAVGWSRVVLRDHTQAQVIAGGVVGAVVAAGTMQLLR